MFDPERQCIISNILSRVLIVVCIKCKSYVSPYKRQNKIFKILQIWFCLCSGNIYFLNQMKWTLINCSQNWTCDYICNLKEWKKIFQSEFFHLWYILPTLIHFCFTKSNIFSSIVFMHKKKSNLLEQSQMFF